MSAKLPTSQVGDLLNMPYELRTEKFSGPLEKLLELIEAQKMDVSEVSMARVTEDFLRYIKKIKSAPHEDGGEVDGIASVFREDLRLVADFIMVASKLIFLKSKYLLPGLALTEEEEADIKDLEGRLKMYQALKPALRIVAKLWRGSHRSYSRQYFILRAGGLAARANVFYPGGNVTAAALAGSLGQILEIIKTYELETRTIKEKIVTLEEKIVEVLARIEREGNIELSGRSKDIPRADLILLFLAVLHLARDERVALRQNGIFSDIIVQKK
jgi:segregation and condensation protein A